MVEIVGRIWNEKRMVLLLVAAMLFLALFPLMQVRFMVGHEWRGVLPSLADEGLYWEHVQAIGTGNLTDGNPYFLEHHAGPPLVLFGGAWINAIPMWFGLSLNHTLTFNFLLWSLVFVTLFYVLLRECGIAPIFSAGGVLLQYLLSYGHIIRPANLQPVYPFFILFYIALLFLLKNRRRSDSILLGIAAGATFYLYAYLWQALVVTMGLLFLYALVRKDWFLLRSALLATGIAALIGLPALGYLYWISHQPYFWESISRFGLVYTHIPMAEIVYSGGWIGVMGALLSLLWWRVPFLRQDARYLCLFLFLALTGLGLWVTQGSNLITGKLLETGEHVRLFILPWFALATFVLVNEAIRLRAHFSPLMRGVCAAVLSVAMLMSGWYTYKYVRPYFASDRQEDWHTIQSYAKPLAWLEAEESQPVVVWSDPKDSFTAYVPLLTKHYTLFFSAAMWQLVPDEELQERYLVSSYFTDLTRERLQEDMAAYLGRHRVYHIPKTIEREIKICKILHWYDRTPDCGTAPTAAELMGEPFWESLEQKFVEDVRPNIRAYLNKYQVSYVIKDRLRDPDYKPESLGERVYADGRFEIYRVRQ